MWQWHLSHMRTAKALTRLRICAVSLEPSLFAHTITEPRHDKTNKVSVRPAKIQISLGIRPVWSESSLSAWRKLGSLAIHWVHSEDSDQTGRMPRLIWVFAGSTHILLVLSWGGSYSVVEEASDKEPTLRSLFLCHRPYESHHEKTCLRGFATR